VTIWPIKASAHLNTLNLGGDGDEVDLLEDVERNFSIRFQQKDVEELVSMGDLEALVALKRGRYPASGEDWERLGRIAREHLGNPGRIDRKTTLFVKFAQPREI